jgi:Recombination endonuclease VII
MADRKQADMAKANADETPARSRQREYQRQWYLKNREKVLDRQRQYQAANPDRRREWYLRNRDLALERSRTWYAENREQAREYRRQYYLKNREKLKAGGRRYRHGLRDDDWAAMWDAQGGCCYLCDGELDADETNVDHDHSCCGPDKSCPVCRRGLAHSLCNIAIGAIGDDPDKLRRMADALEQAKADVAQRLRERGEQITLF